MRLSLVLSLFSLVLIGDKINCREVYNKKTKWPTVVITLLAKNKGGALPYVFSCLKRLSYPKDRIFVWIHTDHNEDNTVEIIQDWQTRFADQYNGVFIEIDTESGPLQKDQKHASQWTKDRFKHVIKLREMALDFARKKWADYILMLDADAFLTDRETLKFLVNKEHAVSAPMLLSDGMYSNFWAAVNDKYFYERIDKYETIYNKKEVGCFDVPMVHSAVLISLRIKESDRLTYDPKKMVSYNGPPDDIIGFAKNARMNDLNLTICNDHNYGFIAIPVDENNENDTERLKIINLKVEALGRGIILPLDKSFEKYVTYPEKNKYNMSQIFMINLNRRLKRRRLMMQSFHELGMDANIYHAVDGADLTPDSVAGIGVTLLPHYEDPFHKRPMKMGEVGCFLSHYYIWREVCRNNWKATLILEDDVHFVSDFEKKFKTLINETENLDWDLIYIGRKILDLKEERVSEHLVKPEYSYWTLGYIISEQGARKLVQAEPLSKLVPVDEFLPIMFDKHPNTTWKLFFPNRNLKAYSASPLLIQPTHYTGQPGYISDTENSEIIDPLGSGEPEKPAETEPKKRSNAEEL